MHSIPYSCVRVSECACSNSFLHHAVHFNFALCAARVFSLSLSLSLNSSLGAGSRTVFKLKMRFEAARRLWHVMFCACANSRAVRLLGEKSQFYCCVCWMYWSASALGINALMCIESNCTLTRERFSIVRGERRGLGVVISVRINWQKVRFPMQSSRALQRTHAQGSSAKKLKPQPQV
jgi:hypothetical protein